MRKGSSFSEQIADLFRTARFRMPVLLPGALASWACVASVGLGGCGFNPEHDYGVTATWLLNASTPDKARCDELGIAQFRLTMDGSGPAKKLAANCTELLTFDGVSYGGFETSESFDYGVDYAYTVDALDDKGKPVYRYESSIIAYYGDYAPVDLNTVDVFEPLGKTAAFSAQWLYSDGDLAADCARNQVSKVVIWVTSATDPDFFDFATLAEADCASGLIESDGKVLASGDYFFQYVALSDKKDAIAEMSKPIRQTVDGSGDVTLPRHQFEGL